MSIEGAPQQEKIKIDIDTVPLRGNDEDLESMKSVINTLRQQINDEWKYERLLFAFGGSLNTNYTGEFFVARSGEEIAGVAVASIDGEKGELKAIFVPEDFRNKGIGQTLTEETMRYLLAHGVSKINASVTSPGALRIIEGLKERYPGLIEFVYHGDYFSH
ncbi:MAG: GNAT family N-acetyltransferase [Candidatus Zambryskibacteria bacterium]|nr:GNAT family N-acetyltransferase [Candidatus Zambryskibacteria bacterium]